MVLWLTGLSGAGKTTLARAIIALAKPYLPALVMIDGDVVRELFGAGLGYDEASRFQQIGRIQRLASLLADQDVPTVVAALYSHPDLMAWNRTNLPGYFEVYIDAPLALVEQRDAKGMYARARAGDMKEVVGIDLPWHVPQSPDMVIDAAAGETADVVARRIVRRVPWLCDAVLAGDVA